MNRNFLCAFVIVNNYATSSGCIVCRFPGLQEIRLVPSRTDIAFVEYENESQATEAMSSLQDFKIVPTHPMKITYANK